MGQVPVRRALLSVYDKSGLVDFAKRLAAAGAELVSSGGTARALAEAGLDVTAVADVTGAPEILGGRVKTLHPAIHGGILAAAGDPSHAADLGAHGIAPFQLVVSNLYPFEQAVGPDTPAAEAVELIDIGGPAMTRAAAKNHAHVGIVTAPAQYDEVAAAVEAGGLDDELRRRLAVEAFFRAAAYDAAIVGWFGRDHALPEHLVVPLRRRAELRYGENPHQPAAAYVEEGAAAWWDLARQCQGKPLSFNNLADAEAGWALACAFTEPAVVVVKHTNPCGVAVRGSLAAAFAAAWACDPLSAFGGVVATNRPLDRATAEALVEVYVEVVIAPEVAAEALDVLAAKPNVRVLAAPAVAAGDLDVRRIERGALVQARDGVGDASVWETRSTRPPSATEQADLEFAWTVAAHTKSNAVVIAKDRMAIGVGAGDQSRVGAAERAVRRAGDRAGGAVAASDAFFPFRDGLDVLADAGVTAVVEPGGSRRDAEVVAAADERGLALVFTGRRHFRH